MTTPELTTTPQALGIPSNPTPAPLKPIVTPDTPPGIPSDHPKDRNPTPAQTSVEPGLHTSELKVLAVWLAGHAAIVVSILGGVGIHLDSDQVTSVLQWIGAESALLTAAYTGFRTWRKRPA